MQITLSAEETTLLLHALKNTIYYRKASRANSANYHPAATEEAAAVFRARTEEYKRLWRKLRPDSDDVLTLTYAEPVSVKQAEEDYCT